MFSVSEPSLKSGYAVLVENDVFEHGAEAARRCKDFRLGLGRQADGLGIAAAFEIEDAVLAPAVFVVADQRALRIGRQRRLAGARKTEEDRRVAIRADIGGAMHRHHPLGRQQVVEHREDRFLHFAGIGRAADQDDALGEIAGNHGFCAATMTGRIALEIRQVDDRQPRRESGERSLFRADQQVADEQRMPGEFRYDTRRQGVFRIGTADQVLNIKRLALGMVEHVLMQDLEVLRRHLIVVVPPDFVRRIGVADDEFVLRGTARMLSRQGTHSAMSGQLRFAAAQDFLIKFSGAEVIPNHVQVGETD